MSLSVCPVGHVICPYNKSHVIRAERMQFHLTKCLPNAGDKPFVVCPFNSTHLIPATEINNHKTNVCPDRNKLETFLYEMAGSKPLFPVKPIEIESAENWDNVVSHTYDPEKLLNEKKLLVLKQVAPPSERKKFHAEQRKKFQTLPDDEPISRAKNNPKPRQPNSKSIITQAQDALKTSESVAKKEMAQVEEKKLPPIIENVVAAPEKKKTGEFELVVGKKKNKKTNAQISGVQKEAVKTKESQAKKNEPKVKKQAVLNEKNTNENLKVTRDDPGNVESKENFTDEPTEDGFIVVTKKKNKTRKH